MYHSSVIELSQSAFRHNLRFLRNRLSPPPIGCDASGRIRDAVADIGAYEH